MRLLKHSIFLIGFLFSMPTLSHSDIVFTDHHSKEILKFEEQIAYFFGVEDRTVIAKHYIQAIKALEANAFSTDAIKRTVMRPFLEKAYQGVIDNTHLEFNVKKAAEIEAALILGQANRESFEHIVNIMMALYQEIFGNNSEEVKKAAMLRTFLYQYKTAILNQSGHLTQGDRDVMMSIAKSSEEILNTLSQSDSIQAK